MGHQPEHIEPAVIEAATSQQQISSENGDIQRLQVEGEHRHGTTVDGVDTAMPVMHPSPTSTTKSTSMVTVDNGGHEGAAVTSTPHSTGAAPLSHIFPISHPSTADESSTYTNIPLTSPPHQHTTDMHTPSNTTDAVPASIRPEAARRVDTTRSLATSFATSAMSEDQLKEELEGRPDKPQALWRCLINRNLPAPVPKHTMENAPLMPRYKASWISKLTYTWIQPLITLGYQRFLVKEDLWKMGDEDESAPLADKVISNWEKRLQAVEDWNTGIDNGTVTVKGWKRVMWKLRRKRKDFKKDVPGLEWAVSDTFFVQFWTAGLIKIAADTLNITSPLVTRKIITFGTQRYLAARNVPGYTSPPIGEGFGWAVLLLFMQLFSSFCMHAFFAQTMTVGVFARGALIAALYRRAVGLSGKARATITTGKLVNHISTDISRIDFAAGFFHMSWTAPIQLVVVIGILCQQMGAVALTGVAFVLIATPLQGIAMKKMFTLRQKAMIWTDKRAKLIQELLGGMRILKFFAWEDPYLAKLAGLRKQELTKIRTLLLLRAATMAVAMSLPALATVIAFTAYAYTNPNDSRNPATIFTSLTLFNLLRMPLMLLPVALATATDAKNAFNRLREVFLAEQLTRTYTIDRDSKYALTVENASFLWETSPPKDETKKSKGEKAAAKAAAKQEKKAEKAEKLAQKAHSSAVAAAAKQSIKQTQPTSRMPWKRSKNVNIAATEQAASDAHDSEAVTREVTDAHIPVPPAASSSGSSDTREGSIDEAAKGKEQIGATGADGTPDEIREKSGLVSEPVADEARDPQVKDVTIRIPHGQLCAIVGPVGSGKSSLLAGLIGEMKVLRGDVKFGGSVGYCAQQAWIQNATVRDNILFGQEWDAKRYSDAVYNACLTADLEMLPHGDQTEIGEKGINLSGGQKQRVNIARALYFNADITLFDDPLSAVDAHVGHHLFEHALRGALAGKTRILVTHALHFLPRVDNIITIENGRVVEQGTYDELIARNGAFAALVAEFGNQEEEEAEDADAKAKTVKESKKGEKKDRKKEKATKLMQEEERATGAVGAAVYGKYLRAAGFSVFPLVLVSLILMQTATVINSYFLVWWQQNTFNKDTGFYLGLYAATAIASAMFTFVMGAAAAFMGFNVSSALHKAAIVRVLHAPMSLFDTTPLGRIMNRFAKDMDTIDNTLNDSMRMALSTFSQIMGSIVLIAIVNQYFLVAVLVILILYGDFARVYRYSAREVKRLDNLLRSSLYAHFSESLSGLATIRAYGETPHFLKKNAFHTDVENRAYYLTVINQRWLGIRLDWLGIALVFVVAVIAVTESENISPSQIGLILSFILGIQMAFTFAVRQLAEVENDMNSVERLLHYGDNLEQEAAFQIPEKKPAPSWPAKGQITFDNVQLRYRPGLPLVLHGLSLEVKGGEKIGVIGRTGAGKSSLMQAVFRIVELDAGSITIDGQDIAKIGLFDLRSHVAIIPQDALLFSGTLRSNLDPFGNHDDARLWNALRRAYLVDRQKGGKGAAEQSRFNLDMTIDEEGQNLSVGERSLVSLARALVKDSRVVILDEATASVDLATDALIQRTIRTEFSDKTLLTIAHRLKTIISYDRVLVMDKGLIAEFATPIELYDQSEGIFRGMCEQSNITRDDIIKAKTESILSDHDVDVLKEAVVTDVDSAVKPES